MRHSVDIQFLKVFEDLTLAYYRLYNSECERPPAFFDQQRADRFLNRSMEMGRFLKRNLHAGSQFKRLSIGLHLQELQDLIKLEKAELEICVFHDRLAEYPVLS